MTCLLTVFIIVMALLLTKGSAFGADLPEIQKNGVLRHLGIAYANFVTGDGDGLEPEFVRLFAREIGVEYEFVETSWDAVIGDLTGNVVRPKEGDIEIVGEVPVRGDIIATGFTILPWREKVVNFSVPTFPTQVWLVTHAESPLKPIRPTGNISEDILAVKALLHGMSVLTKPNTCLDPSLYKLDEAGTTVKIFQGNLNELAPAVVSGEADYTLLDVADTFVALKKWPGRIKVIGPLSLVQNMGYAFAKSSPMLLHAFNRFFARCVRDGTYRKLVNKYYPAVFHYFPDFFRTTP